MSIKCERIAMGIDAKQNKEKKINLYLEDNGNREYVTIKDLIETIEKDKKFAEESGRLEEFLNEKIVMNISDIHGQIVQSKMHTDVGWCDGGFVLCGNADSLEFVDEDKQNIELIKDEFVNMKKEFGCRYHYNGHRELLEKFYFTFGYSQKYEGKYQPIKAINYDLARNKMIELYGNDWCVAYEEDDWYKTASTFYNRETDELKTITVEV